LDHAPAGIKRLSNPYKINVARETRKGTAKFYSSAFSVGKPASVQCRQPPSMEMQFV